jgi:hypothetical protein
MQAAYISYAVFTAIFLVIVAILLIIVGVRTLLAFINRGRYKNKDSGTGHTPGS